MNVSEDLIRLGIAPSNMVPNQPTLDAGPLLTAGVNYAAANKMTTVIADPGSYYFMNVQPGCHVNVPSLQGITLDLQGSGLYFEDLSAPGICTSGVNVTLQNFTIDYLNLPFTQLLISSVNPAQNQVLVAVQPGYPKPSSLNALFTPGVTPTAYLFRDGQPWPLSDRITVLTPLTDSSVTFESQGPPANPAMVGLMRPGDVVVIVPVNSGSPGVYMTNCTRCTLRNIKIYAGGEGPWSVQGEGLLVERVYLMPRPGTDRLLCCGGDAMQMTGPNNTLRWNRYIRTFDEGPSGWVSFYGSVEAVLGSQALQLQGGGIGFSSNSDTLAQGRSMPNGTPVQFQRLSDATILASAVVVSQTPAPAIGGLNQMIVTFDRDLPSGLVGTYVYPVDPNQRGGNTSYEQNTVQYQITGPALESYGLMNSAISGNYTRRTPFAGIWVDGHTDTGYGATPPPQNITVSYNVIDGANSYLGGASQLGPVYTSEGWGLASIQTSEVAEMGFGPYPGVAAGTGLLQNISILNNFIVDSGRSGILVSNTENSAVSGNYLLNPDINPRPEILIDNVFSSDILEPFVINASSNVSTTNNVIDTTSGRLWVTDLQFNELAAYAPGETYRLNAYGLGALPSPSVTLTDATGVAYPVTIVNTSTHALDVSIPASAALGGAYFTLSSGSVTYFGTLFVDSQDNIPALNGCTYETSLSSASVPAEASSLPILVVTQAACSYQPLNGVTLASLSAGATGTGVIALPFPANLSSSQTVTIEIAGQPIAIAQAGQPPVIQAIYDVWNYTAGVAPGAWVTITGTVLASGAPQTWTVIGSQLPTMLNGVTVTFNGLPATLEYVSPTQINALVPAGLTPGPVQVVIQNGTSRGSPFTTTATAILPAIYALPNATGTAFYVTAPLEATALLVGNSAVDSRALRAAEPGDVLDLYMIGLGATADPTVFTTTQGFAAAYPVSASVAATIGGESAQVLFAGLTSPGLYLVRVVVPSDLRPGQVSIQISAAGSTTSSLLLLTLQAAPPGNLVGNGTFTLPLGNFVAGGAAPSGNWAFNANASQGAAAAAQETSSTAAVGNASLQVTVTSAATNTGNYCAIQLGQGGLPFRQGDVVSVEFWAKADTARPLWMNVVQNGGSYPSYGLNGSVGLGTSWQQYLIYFQSTATDPAGRLDFCMGDVAGTVWLDGVVLQDTNQ
ncbi:MAG TPA: IPT/TIG domain-containing protein [Bryobacteraceae bacterium]|nr:IPT/TIG domain-containing protein [Bryobacteraceae bacterium]